MNRLCKLSVLETTQNCTKINKEEKDLVSCMGSLEQRIGLICNLKNTSSRRYSMEQLHLNPIDPPIIPPVLFQKSVASSTAPKTNWSLKFQLKLDSPSS